MTEFTFKERKNILIPQADVFRPPCDKDGRQLSGDELIRRMSSVAENFEKKTKRPVPVEPKFVAWLHQAKDMLGKGISSEEIFAKTIVMTGV